MKTLLFLILFIPIFLSAQEGAVFKETVDDVVAGTETSSQINLGEDHKFHGTWGLALSADTSTAARGNTQGGKDSLVFFPLYRIAGIWVVGDTITWNVVNSDVNYSSTVKYVVPEDQIGNTLVWQTDPEVSTNIHGYPYEFVKVRKTEKSDSLGYIIDLRSNEY